MLLDSSRGAADGQYSEIFVGIHLHEFEYKTKFNESSLENGFDMSYRTLVRQLNRAF